MHMIEALKLLLNILNTAGNSEQLVMSNDCMYAQTCSVKDA